MKKFTTLLIVFSAPFILQAQGRYNLGNGFYMDDEVLKISASILVLYLFITFIITIIRAFLDFRLKSKMVDKGVSEKIVDQFLQPGKDSKAQALKAFLLLAATGIGLAVINYTLPLGVHSIAVLAISLSLAFLGYFYYLKQSESR
jgi:hypothetical protein